MPNTVNVGTEFNSLFADSSPRWRVTKSRGRGVWEATVISEDWTGTTKVFDERDIIGSIRQAEVFDSLRSEDDMFWEAQEIGTTLHYHDGFGQFVRGIIVNDDGEKKLQPKALVGNWSQRDLAARRPNGEIDYGYHARKIMNGEGAWRPSITCVYEATPSCGRGVNPTALNPLSLTLPPMSAEEKATAAKEKLRTALRDALQERDVDVALANARAILGETV